MRRAKLEGRRIGRTLLNIDREQVVADHPSRVHELTLLFARADGSLAGSSQHDRPEPSYCDTGHVDVPADANRATTNSLFGPGCCGNSFATGAAARTVALKDVRAACHGRPFVLLLSDCPQNVSLAMI